MIRCWLSDPCLLARCAMCDVCVAGQKRPVQLLLDLRDDPPLCVHHAWLLQPGRHSHSTPLVLLVGGVRVHLCASSPQIHPLKKRF
jgi:hypothetical protein